MILLLPTNVFGHFSKTYLTALLGCPARNTHFKFKHPLEPARRAPHFLHRCDRMCVWSMYVCVPYVCVWMLYVWDSMSATKINATMEATDPPLVGITQVQDLLESQLSEGTTDSRKATDPPFVGITQVLDLLESQLSEGTESSWSRPLIFRGCLVRPHEIPHSVHFKQENLVEHTNNRIFKNCKLYFDREQYAPLQGSQKASSKDPAWNRLCTDLMRAGHGAGMSLISNGQGSNGSRRLVCNHGIFYDKRWAKKKNAVKSEDYRPTTLNADYRNNRDDGRSVKDAPALESPKWRKGSVLASGNLRLVVTSTGSICIAAQDLVSIPGTRHHSMRLCKQLASACCSSMIKTHSLIWEMHVQMLDLEETTCFQRLENTCHVARYDTSTQSRGSSRNQPMAPVHWMILHWTYQHRHVSCSKTLEVEMI